MYLILRLNIVFLFVLCISCNEQKVSVSEDTPPNIVWIVIEDQSPEFFPFYNNTTVSLPNLEALASDGMIFDKAFAPVPVCAPARSAIITGMYPSTLGTHNMRTYNSYNPENETEIGISSYSPVVPAGVKVFTEYLRKAGYYCSNNAKEDYNFKTPEQTWNASGPEAHWKDRSPDQPFFSVFNFGICHESGIWRYQDSTLLVSTSDVKVPPYFPDTKVVRHDLAVNYSNLIRVDRHIGKIIAQLKKDGLYDQSYIFFYSDHGGPFPRHKRALYDTGIRVPMLVKLPEGKNAGQRSDQLLSFIDLAPTVLSIAGIEPPAVMQGLAFLGQFRSTDKRKYLFASSDRYDELTDRLRAVRTLNLKYIRSYNTNLPHALPVSYREQMPLMQELNKMYANGQLNNYQSQWLRSPKPAEELYDLKKDPYELNNLALSPEWKDSLLVFREVLKDWIKESKDLGEIPEKELMNFWLAEGEQKKLDTPEIQIKEDQLLLYHPKPDASLLWRYKTEADWEIYSGKLSIRGPIEIKATRIGFTDSEIIHYLPDEH